MHDIKAIRDDETAFVTGMNRRGLDGAALAADLLAKDRALRDVLIELQEKQARRNEASKAIGQAKAKKDEAAAASLMLEVAGLKDAIQAGEERERVLQAELRDALAKLPNVPCAEAPDGPDEEHNVEVMTRFFAPPEPPPGVTLNAPKEHFELGEALGMMDFERAAKISGARFVYLTKHLARLERALGAFMLDLHTEHFGYTEVSPPLMVRDEAMFGTGQLPKFEEDLFFTDPRDAGWRARTASWLRIASSSLGEGDENRNYTHSEVKHIVKTTAENAASIFSLQEFDATRDFESRNLKRFGLIPTAEVSLTNYVNDQILDEGELPLRFTAHTPCFRAEAGAAGRDSRGMIRMHQFAKVELVSIATPEQSGKEHERMTDAAQEVLKRLELKHRVVTLCTGDMGFSAQKTYDIEVWLPGQGRYREISSCSNCGDFQGRRMNARFRPKDAKATRFVHTLNGSGLAVGRTLVAVLENYQNADGSVEIPAALVPYMGGLKRIERA